MRPIDFFKVEEYKSRRNQSIRNPTTYYFSGFARWNILEHVRQMGWPKKKGFFFKSVVDRRVLDVAVEQTILISVGLGAGRPEIALAALADTWPNDPWTNYSAAELVQRLAQGEHDVRRNPGLLPWKALNFNREVGLLRAVSWDAVGGVGGISLATLWANLFSRGIYWGLTHEQEMPDVFANAREDYETAANDAVQAALDMRVLFPWDSLELFYENCDGLFRQYESIEGPLPSIPNVLREFPEIARRLTS